MVMIWYSYILVLLWSHCYHHWRRRCYRCRCFPYLRFLYCVSKQLWSKSRTFGERYSFGTDIVYRSTEEAATTAAEASKPEPVTKIKRWIVLRNSRRQTKTTVSYRSNSWVAILPMETTNT